MTQLITKLIRHFKGCVTALEEYKDREEVKAKSPSTYPNHPVLNPEELAYAERTIGDIVEASPWESRLTERAEAFVDRFIKKHPIQPLEQDDRGVVRFKSNAIVRYLLDAGPYDMNALAVMPFDDSDRTQFAQLIGYSLSGLSDLDYVSDEAFEAAERLSQV